MGIRSGPNIVTDGLVFAVDAANPSSYVSGSTIWKDQTVSQNNGTLTNGPTFDSVDGGSIVFDGTNDYVNLNTNTLSSVDPITIIAWINPNSLTATQCVISDGTTGGVSIRLEFGRTDNTFSWNQSGVAATANANAITTTDNFHQVAIVRSGNYSDWTISFYVNGNAWGSTSGITQTPSSTPSNCSIGSRGDGSGLYFNGKISNVKIYNRALSSTEVSQNYNALKPRFGL